MLDLKCDAVTSLIFMFKAHNEAFLVWPLDDWSLLWNTCTGWFNPIVLSAQANMTKQYRKWQIHWQLAGPLTFSVIKMCRNWITILSASYFSQCYQHLIFINAWFKEKQINHLFGAFACKKPWSYNSHEIPELAGCQATITPPALAGWLV